MMSILEYALDVNKSSEQIMKLCDKLAIKYNDEESFLSEDDIILLDNEIQDGEDYVVDEEEFEEEVLDERVEKILSESNIDLDTDNRIEKLKPKSERVENGKINFQKEKKKI